MAILSSTIRRSHVMRRLLLDKSSNGFLMRQQQQQYALAYRRGLHATSAAYGDALDMADTFSRRHGECIVINSYIAIVDSI
jgi:hypothetical protein